MIASTQLVHDGAVATVTLVPSGAITSLSRATVSALESALDELESIDDLRCVVVEGTGASFVVGADLNELHGLSVAESLAHNARLIAINDRLERLCAPVIACINGHAFGGGLELALACSLRVASAEATMGLPEVKLGIVPAAGGIVRLPRTIGRGAATSMLLTGRTVGADEALRIGLVDEVVADGRAAERAQAIAAEIARRGPLAVALVARALRETQGMPTAAAVASVHDQLGALLASDDAVEGIAAFVEKRAPRFAGR